MVTINQRKRTRGTESESESERESKHVKPALAWHTKVCASVRSFSHPNTRLILVSRANLDLWRMSEWNHNKSDIQRSRDPAEIRKSAHLPQHKPISDVRKAKLNKNNARSAGQTKELVCKQIAQRVKEI